MADGNLYWGDSHTNLHLGNPKWKFPLLDYDDSSPDEFQRNVAELEAATDYARTVMDFWPMAYYPYTYKPVDGFKAETWRNEPTLAANWRAVCDVAARHNCPGEFVIFPGYEWHGDARHGDHNVFFLRDNPPLLTCDGLDELYAELRGGGLAAYAIPHHTAYLPGNRSKDWSVHDEAISPFAEIFSQHGCSESDAEYPGLRKNAHMGPGVSGGTIEDGLAGGVRTGIIASNDSHHNLGAVYGWGIMACWARELTRESLWEAFAARRVYGTTGDRIALELDVEGALMGAEIDRSGPVRIAARVRGCDAIDRIELLRNNRIIAAKLHTDTWEPPTGGDRIRCKLRVEAGWGPKPDDIPDLPPREWQCSIRVGGGAVLAAQQAWRTPGQWVGDLGGEVCEFGFRTRQDPPHPFPAAEATVFELEARPSDTITIVLNDKTVRMTLAEAMARSQLVVYEEEAARRIHDLFGTDTDAIRRRDRIKFHSYEVKLHRAVPEIGYDVELTHTDEAPPASVNHYRVRVHQRNGQIAWSSPVWVSNE